MKKDELDKILDIWPKEPNEFANKDDKKLEYYRECHKYWYEQTQRLKGAFEDYVESEKWIPVTSKLPEKKTPEGKELLCYMYGDTMTYRCEYDHERNKWEWLDYQYDDGEGDPTLEGVILWKYIDLPEIR
jgi:hypothetical protein